MYYDFLFVYIYGLTASKTLLYILYTLVKNMIDSLITTEVLKLIDTLTLKTSSENIALFLKDTLRGKNLIKQATICRLDFF